MKKKIILLLFIIIFFLLLSSIVFALININNTNILHGISINNIDISCLSKEEATKKINEIIEKKYNTDIIIYYPDNTEKTISLESINTNYNVSSAISEAFNVGRTGNIFQNNFEIIKLIKNKKNIELDVTVDNDKINNLINEISSNLPDKLVNVNYYIENNNLVITNGKNGSIIDKDTFLSKLNNIILDLNSDNNTIQAPTITANFEPINIDKIYNEIYKEEKDAYYEKEPFKIYPEVIGISFDKEYANNLLNNYQEEYVIPLTIVNPKITINNLGIDIFKDQLSTFTTKYSISNKERTTNLSLASSKINNTVIAPGEEFSYNKIVGARSIEAGYKEAKIYENGQVVDGIGGGICQISSTLYNTVMFANLEITERHNHQFITSYIPAGRDATVAYGSKDFKFKNNRSYPIKIKSSVNDGIVRISILGIKEDKEYDINFDLKTISTKKYSTEYKNDNTLPINTEKVKQKGIDGMVVSSYKVTKLNGSIISKELIATDTYNSLNELILKGTKNYSTP